MNAVVFSSWLLVLRSQFLSDLTALGGKVGRAGPGIEPEQREGIEVGRNGVKLLTLGVGETDQDAVLQPGQPQIDSIQIASQQLILEMLHIVRRLGSGGIKPPGSGFMKIIVN